MLIRPFLCISIGVIAIDVSHGILMGGSKTFDVITFGRVRRKGALGWFSSKGGMFGIPRFQVPLGMSCCCIMWLRSSHNVLLGYLGRFMFPFIGGGSSNKGLMLMCSNVLWRISMVDSWRDLVGAIIVFENSKGFFPLSKSKLIMGCMFLSVVGLMFGLRPFQVWVEFDNLLGCQKFKVL